MKVWWVLFVFLVAGASVSFGQTKILFLGDSLTAGFGVERAQAYPVLVEQQLTAKGHKVQVQNVSISGSTTASALGRLKWYLKSKPQALFLALGANDGLRGQSVEGMKKNLTACIQLAQQKGLTVYLAGMKMPPNYGKAYTQAFHNAFAEVAQTTQVPLLPFLLKGVAGRTELNQADGIHPNAEGHQKVAALVSDFLSTQLK